MAITISNAAAKVVNLAGGTVAASVDIEGGYFSIDTLENIPVHAKVVGALCYCTSEFKFYQYDGTDWVEPAFSSDLVNFIKKEEISFASTEDIKALFK